MNEFDEEICIGVDNEGLEYYFRDKTDSWRHCGDPRIVAAGQALIDAAEELEEAIGWRAWNAHRFN